MEETKECPLCGETIKSVALICRYCHSDLQSGSKDKRGKFIKVRLKAGEKRYVGDIFVPEYYARVSDVINDSRHFIVLSNAVEEAQTRDIAIGFLAINKNLTEWIELKNVTDEKMPGHESRYLE